MVAQVCILSWFNDFKETLCRYWALTSVFIVLAISIGYVTEWIVYKVKNRKKSAVGETVKVTFDSDSLGNGSLNCDIYAITFMSFAELDALAPRDTQNTTSLINKANDGEVKNTESLPNSEKLANKNFSNCALIFFIQCVLVVLAFTEFKQEDMGLVTY